MSDSQGNRPKPVDYYNSSKYKSIFSYLGIKNVKYCEIICLLMPKRETVNYLSGRYSCDNGTSRADKSGSAVSLSSGNIGRWMRL